MSQAQADSGDLGFDLTNGTRTLNMVRPESGERLNLAYMRNGVWQGDAYNQICWFLRDIHVNEHVRMDTRLIAVIDWTQRYLAKFGYTAPLHLLSGYRSQRTNNRTEGAAKASLHMEGKALDLRIPGLSADYLNKLFQWLSQGGVGHYAGRNFIHFDTGNVRQWKG